MSLAFGSGTPFLHAYFAAFALESSPPTATICSFPFNRAFVGLWIQKMTADYAMHKTLLSQKVRNLDMSV